MFSCDTGHIDKAIITVGIDVDPVLVNRAILMDLVRPHTGRYRACETLIRRVRNHSPGEVI